MELQPFSLRKDTKIDPRVRSACFTRDNEPRLHGWFSRSSINPNNRGFSTGRCAPLGHQFLQFIFCSEVARSGGERRFLQRICSLRSSKRPLFPTNCQKKWSFGSPKTAILLKRLLRRIRSLRSSKRPLFPTKLSEKVVRKNLSHREIHVNLCHPTFARNIREAPLLAQPLNIFYSSAVAMGRRTTEPIKSGNWVDRTEKMITQTWTLFRSTKREEVS